MRKQIIIILLFLLILLSFPRVESATAPSVTTNDAEGVEEYNATLSGTLTNDGGENCTVWFEYGTTTAYGSNTSGENITCDDIWSNFTTGANARYGFTKFGQYYKKEFFNHNKIYIKEVWIAGRGYQPSTVITARACIKSDFTTYIQNSTNTVDMSDTSTYYQFTFSPYVEIDDIDFIVTCEAVDGNSTFFTSAKSGNVYDNTWRIENNGNKSTWETKIKLKYYNATYFSANITSLYPGQLYHYRAVAQNSNSTVYGSDKTFTTLWYPLSNASHTPNSGISNFTNFTFNITYQDMQNRSPNIKVNISTTGWYTNQSMTWQSGSNLTGANYTYTTTLPIAGSYTYRFTAYLGSISYTTSSYSITGDVTNVTFNISFPPYLEVGDYIFADGTIRNSTGGAVDGYWAYTTIQRYNDSVTMLGPKEYFCTNGRYSFIASTGILTPGIYNITVEFQDTTTGYTYGYTHTLYLSYTTPQTGVYSDAIVYFNFYNTNQGLGLPQETLKLYVDNQRLYNTFYYTYTGNTINVVVKDFYNTTLYSSNITINETRTFIDLGLTFHSWLFGNKNDNYYMISLLKQGATRWWERGVVPYGEREYLIPSGNYTLRIYDSDYTEIYNETQTINTSKVYVIHGTNLSEIIRGISVIKGQLLEEKTETGDQLPEPNSPKTPRIKPPVYATGYNMAQCYNILKADKLQETSTSITMVVMDSGIVPQTFNNIDMTKILRYYHPNYENGYDTYGHGSFINYEVAYILQQKLPNAKQISYRAFDNNGASTQKIFIESINQIKNLNPDVVSISAGAWGTKDDIYSKKIKELHDMGIIVVSCAAGNYGPNPTTILSPALSQYAIAIGSSNPQGTLDPSDDTICQWSSRGPVPNLGEPKPDVVAPGESIRGPWRDLESTISGTSLSTALVSGGTAVVVAQHKPLIEVVKTLWFWNKGVVPDAYENALENSCIPKGDPNTWGAGIVQFDKTSENFYYNLLSLIFIPLILLFSLVVLIINIYKYFFP